MSKDISARALTDLITSPANFSLHLDETTAACSLIQLAVFVRYVKDVKMKGKVDILPAYRNSD